ncbi:Acetyltransferase (GNAT) family protein [Promicromonospora umidemergens]|uniref:N-acetyltransferase domain-containing protein n=1 Tax=Promicromonospora umidemergens TaxID=629679 RepID=A0ABP8XYJ0_9MICO|nr:GNAT family N-acetyltransferase [Promicromonospora umidemergens]MCP2284296.1 Acetyltransferase (GNAT) family protein [Promicromonospora umidemergens]
MTITISSLSVPMIDGVISLMDQGDPFIRARTASDYWAYATLFSSTCPVAFVDGVLAGAVTAFRSQDDPSGVYVQDVMVHPDHRRQGVATALLDSVVVQARTWGCTRLWLTSEPGNRAADASWRARVWTNLPGDQEVDGVEVKSNFKGPGKDRAVYELLI